MNGTERLFSYIEFIIDLYSFEKNTENEQLRPL